MGPGLGRGRMPGSSRIGDALMADERRFADSRFAGARKRRSILRSLASYRASFLTGDLVAALTLVAVAIPEQMATARLGGFSPEIGIAPCFRNVTGYRRQGMTPHAH